MCEYTNTEFGSPLNVTPLFTALAATIPSPKFSESVRILKLVDLLIFVSSKISMLFGDLYGSVAGNQNVCCFKSSVDP